MIAPLLFAVIGGNKMFCQRYCGRRLLFMKLGAENKWSRNVLPPQFMLSKNFRYAVLCLFVLTFANVLWQTYLVFADVRSIKEFINILYVFTLPWNWSYANVSVPNWILQFSYGFYSLMLSSTCVGLIVMYFYKPRTWCSFCPMGTMTQDICRIRKK